MSLPAVPAASLDGLSILVTGGTGTFGKALVRELLAQHSSRRVVEPGKPVDDDFHHWSRGSERRLDAEGLTRLLAREGSAEEAADARTLEYAA